MRGEVARPARPARPGPPPASARPRRWRASSPAAPPTARNARRRGYAADLADAAQRSGIADDGFGPVDAGDDLLAARPGPGSPPAATTSGEIRGLLQAIRDAQGKRGRTPSRTSARSRPPSRSRSRLCEAAAARLAQARQSAAANWPPGPAAGPATGPGSVDDQLPDRLVVTAAEAEALARALDHLGEPGAASVAEVFDGRTAERQAARIAARANLETELRDVGERLAGLRAERDAIAAEQDDAPPASDLRPACRDERPGAPLWQLVRFADGTVDDTQAAAVEGALYGAGLLTAWVHPDPALTGAALAAAEADGYLVPAAPVAPATGRTLADVLVPEEQGRVAPEAVVSRWVHPLDRRSPGPTSSGPEGGGTVPAVSTKAQFTLRRPRRRPAEGGPRVHRRNQPGQPPPRPARGTRRADRGDRAPTRSGWPASWTGPARCWRTSGGPGGNCRIPARSRSAAEAVGTHAALLARARDETAGARKALDAAIAEVDARTRQLRQAAAERRMPTAAEQVDAIARAAAEFENAATQLHAERAKLAQAEEDLAEQAETIERRQLESTPQAEDALAERDRLQQALEEEFRTLEETLQADVQQVLEQIRQTERLIRAADEAYRELDARARAEHDKATARAADVRGERRCARRRRSGSCTSRPGSSASMPGPTCVRSLGVTAAAPWPEPARWPDPGPAGEELADRRWPATDEPPDPAAAVRGVLPPGVTEILDAFAAATRGGRQVTEGTLKNTADRMSVALKDFTEALAACDEDYRVDWEPGARRHRARDRRRGPQAGRRSSPPGSPNAPPTRACCWRSGSARCSRTSCSPRWPSRSTAG